MAWRLTLSGPSGAATLPLTDQQVQRMANMDAPTPELVMQQIRSSIQTKWTAIRSQDAKNQAPDEIPPVQG